jgi:hypothetical protein
LKEMKMTMDVVMRMAMAMAMDVVDMLVKYFG